MTIKPVGGRGKKAPYETTVVRIPKDLEGCIEVIVSKYRRNLLQESEKREKVLEFSAVTRDEAIEIKEKIVKMKKSAKLSLERFIQEVYY